MIFVTGGTGLVGAHLLYDLVKTGEKVRALRRIGSSIRRTEKIFASYGSEYQSLMRNIEWVEGDIIDKEGLRDLLEGVDQIYHAAAMISFDPRDRDMMIFNNCTGTANLADLALSLHIPRFCYVSSIAALGTPPDGIEANEDHPWRNNRDHSAYAESKYLSEMEVWRACFQGLNTVIVNPSVIIGPGDWNSGSSVLFTKIWKGLKFYTKGGTGFVDVRDVSSAMQVLMKEEVWDQVKNNRYILNAGNVTYKDFFNQVAASLHVKAPGIKAGDFLLNSARRLSWVKSLLTGSAPSLTRETERSAKKLSYYDGSKICRTIGFEYRSLETSIRFISSLFLKDHPKK